jgi:UDP:flavonoid glycosyltransferase YjiC (YdhE family)
MKSMHVTFCLEQQYGHIVPTLGMALELSRRGHRVTYAVIEALAPLVSKIRARALIVNPLDTRIAALSALSLNENGAEPNLSEAALQQVAALSRARTACSLEQFREVYRGDMPDVVIHDDVYDTAGRAFAVENALPKVRLQSQFIDENDPNYSNMMFDHDELILVTVPEFFQRAPELYTGNPRFKFVGFIPEGRSLVFKPWTPVNRPDRFILVSATTGMAPQIKYCQMILEAVRGQPWDVVLSISASMDRTSDIDAACLKDIPANVQLNRSAGNFQIVEGACLFVGQGGQGATLESIYWGVPQIVVPPTPYHTQVARRVSELGLGRSLPISELSRKRLLQEISSLLDDHTTLKRAREASDLMRNCQGAILAAEAIEIHAEERFL